MLAAPGPVSLALCAGLAAIGGASVTLRAAGALLPVQHSPRLSLSETALPPVSVIVPLYKEAAVIPALMNSLSRLDYPPGRLDILLAVEAHDHETLTAARAAARSYLARVIAVPAEERPPVGALVLGRERVDEQPERQAERVLAGDPRVDRLVVRRAARDGLLPMPDDDALAFLPVSVSTDAGEPPRDGGEPLALEIGDVRIIVPPTFDPSHLGRVIAAIRGAP